MEPSTFETRRRKREQSIDYLLSRIFKKTDFRHPQRDVIEASLQGSDVFFQAATSFGKSLCFQLPALIDHGITIVISPLLALMRDQVAHLTLAGIKAKSLNSTISSDDRREIYEDLARGHPTIEILYVTPETCAGDHFRGLLRKVYSQNELAHFAIDEAHCISEWGHDFRPSYKKLRYLKEQFSSVPIMCLTATATSRVREDILETLGLDTAKLKIFRMTTARSNLHYEVRFKRDGEDQFDSFLSWIRSVHERRGGDEERRKELERLGERIDGICGIIYTLYREDCVSIASRLQDHGIGAKPYHAGLSNSEKDDHQAGWVEGRRGYDIIVATTAFGMGINKDNVRFVCHWQIPKSFEGFYQEAGRAGRDGKASACIMCYGREDRERGLSRIYRERSNTGDQAARLKSYQAVVNYCESTLRCRHAMISDYFGEKDVPKCDYACDWHKDPRGLRRKKELGLASEDWCSTQKEIGGFGVEVVED